MKLKKDPVTVDTLEEYLAEASDFSFELRILEMLSEKGINCEHGGQYKDPDTKKFREFDLRARVTKGHVTVAAAIECKSIGHHFPLLVSCVHRSEAEAYHQAFIHEAEQAESRGPLNLGISRAMLPEVKDGITVRPSILYPIGGHVGKSTAQVGRRDTNNADIHANDAEFFEKWTQALQSLDDLVYEISDEDMLKSHGNGVLHAALPLPIVVVPDGTLWSVNYSNEGRREGSPSQVNRVSIYIGRSYENVFHRGSIEVSHLEVMTEIGLRDFCDTQLSDDQSMMGLIHQQ